MQTSFILEMTASGQYVAAADVRYEFVEFWMAVAEVVSMPQAVIHFEWS